MSLKNVALSSGLALCLASTVQADPIFIDVGTDFNGDTDSIVTSFDSLGLTDIWANSIYDERPDNGGGPIIFRDTNYQDVADSFGQTIPPFSQSQVVDNQIDALNGVLGDNEDFGTTLADSWMMFMGYQLDGVINNGIPTYTGGTFDIWFLDVQAVGLTVADLTSDFTTGFMDANATKVLQLNLLGSELVAGNLVFTGEISFNYTNGLGVGDELTALVQNFFNFTDLGVSFFDLWNSGTPPVLAFRQDTNVDVANSTPAQTCGSITTICTLETTVGNEDFFIRQTDLNDTIIFRVPEPSGLALMGLGLLALGAYGRRRVAAA